MAGTDWMWVYENPKDAAAKIDEMAEELAEIRKLLGIEGQETILDVLRSHPDWQS